MRLNPLKKTLPKLRMKNRSHQLEISIPRSVAGYFSLLVVFALSVAIRIPDFRETTGAENIEATYHVLLTAKALQENSIADSKLLPIVTLGAQNDKFIRWGASVPMPNGNLVYTSFTAPGFIAPFAFFQLMQWEPTVTHLIVFNCLLGIITALLLFNLLSRLLERIGTEPSVAILCGLAGASCIVFSREGLHSFGIVYWSQSLEQLILLAQLSVIIAITDPNAEHVIPRAKLFWVALLSFLAPFTEWSGFVGNFFLCVLLLFHSNGYQFNSRRILVGAISLSTALAGAAILVHFASGIGLNNTLSAFVGRFLLRSAANQASSFISLLNGYAASYGLILVVAFCLLIWVVLAHRRYANQDKTGISLVWFAFLASCCPLIENVILLQHATEFSFDRLKLITPLAIIISVALAVVVRNQRNITVATVWILVMLAFAQNIYSYRQQNAAFSDWSSYDQKNRHIKSKIATMVDLSCSLIGTNQGVRGYPIILFEQSIHEMISPEMLKKEASAGQYCAAVYLWQGMVYPDLPIINQAIISAPDHPEIVLNSL